jgi:deoxyribonuclease IV
MTIIHVNILKGHNMILGAHVSTAGGVFKAPLNAKKLGINAIQIFTKNQNQWNAKPLTDENIEKYFANIESCGIIHTVAHDSYLINLCAIESEKMDKSRAAFIDELVRGDQLNLDGVVMHPGSHLKAGEEAGIKAVAESFNYCFDQQPDGKVRVLIETTAGQGTNLGHRFEHIAEMIRLIDNDDRIGVCLDTCHIFAAGYDYRTKEGYDAVMKEFDDVIGLDKLYAFHINDSKKDLGTRVDRHEHIGEGFIGKEPFAHFVNDPRFKDIPALLETPGEQEDYVQNLDLLRSLTVGN